MSDSINVILKCRQEQVSSEKTSLEYAPAGTHSVFATINGNPAVREIHIDEGVAQLLDDDLQTWLDEAATGKVSRPYIDFDHEGKGAAAIPKRFYWDNGIRLEVEWTSAGKDAIEGRNYSYFSPEVMVDKDTGQFIGLPDVGAIGSLVNTPAFQSIERLAAAKTNTNHHPIMDDKEIQKQLDAAEAKLGIFESEKAKLEAAHKSVIEERDRLAAEIVTLTDATAELQKTVIENRKEKITAAIAAKNVKEDAREALLQACLNTDDDGAALLAAFEAPVSKGIPPVKKEDKKSEVQGGLAKLTASISENLTAKGLIHG